MPSRKTELVRERVLPAEKRLWEKAAKIADVDLSEFVRRAVTREIERMRAEGKKI